MSSVPHRHYSVQEYLAREQIALEKSEYYGGDIFAMSGGTPNHNRISGNLFRLTGNHLEGSQDCEVFNSDQGIFISAVTMFTYPDVAIACNPLFENNSLTNPRVICEVLSDSTEAYDRGAKFHFYKKLESLEEYLLVSQKLALVERLVRQADGNWLVIDSRGLESTFRIAAIDFEGRLSDLYRHVEFSAPSEPAPQQGGEPRTWRPIF